MKKLLAIMVLPFSLNAAELVPNYEFTKLLPVLGPFLPVCWIPKTTGNLGTYDFIFPVLDSNGRREAYRLISQSYKALWLVQQKNCRIPVIGGATYRYTVRAKCNVVMNGIMEQYKGTVLLRMQGFQAPTIADNNWHTTVTNVTIPLNTNYISIGPYVAKAGACNFGMVSLQRAN